MQSLRFFTNADVAAALAYTPLIEALRKGLAEPCAAPVRGCQALPDEASLLHMPVWQSGQGIGVKLVTVFPHNGARGLPSVAAVFALFDDVSGQPLALLEASELTARRTACTSALAADYLVRRDAQRLLIVGSGTLAAHMVRAHCSVRAYQQVQIWGRSAEKVAALVEKLAAEGYPVSAAVDLQRSVEQADSITCVTNSRTPLVLGAWLKPGTHLDLVGAFLPSMRETDSAAVARARIVVDIRAGALEEAGDLLFALGEGVIAEADIHLELSDLLQGRGQRDNAEEITLFKSVGYALEDLIAARALLEQAGAQTELSTETSPPQ
ncbi:ornithine cyclodeaminase family protein [Pseudomonas sp. 2FE]|uniref:ornithine cyclodeaminase family protein n=1 Tax=Pseudomonas sp. 2FE TaxID=2502190 RepID=UPI0010F59D81|nr:ornithine cyclodeaminase family protein [Pseudomonas sp. 2FE]